MKRALRTKRRNWVARAVKRLRSKVILPKRGKGSYQRKGRRAQNAGGPDDGAEPGGRR